MAENVLPYGRQQIESEEIEAVVEVLGSPRITQGPAVEAFEEAVADAVGAAHAVAFSSGTAAPHAAMFAAGVGPGDRVLTSPITFVSSANAAIFQGGVPVFADIDPETGCLDAEAAARVPAGGLKAIVPVSYSGYPLELAPFFEMARRCGAVVIEDGSHSLGAEVARGVRVGARADMTTLSFHPVKHITTGEGGMVTTDSDAYAKRLRMFRTHGITKDPDLLEEHHGPWYYEMQELGYNYRLTDIQCALGLRQLARLDDFVARRRAIAARYDALLGPLADVATPKPHPGHGYHLYPVRVPAERRRQVFEGLHERNIGVQVHYIPVPLQPYYRRRFGYGPGDFPRAEAFYAGEISLPMFPAMEDRDVTRVVRALEQLLEQ